MTMEWPFGRTRDSCPRLHHPNQLIDHGSLQSVTGCAYKVPYSTFKKGWWLYDQLFCYREMIQVHRHDRALMKELSPSLGHYFYLIQQSPGVAVGFQANQGQCTWFHLFNWLFLVCNQLSRYLFTTLWHELSRWFLWSLVVKRCETIT